MSRRALSALSLVALCAVGAACTTSSGPAAGETSSRPARPAAAPSPSAPAAAAPAAMPFGLSAPAGVVSVTPVAEASAGRSTSSAVVLVTEPGALSAVTADVRAQLSAAGWALEASPSSARRAVVSPSPSRGGVPASVTVLLVRQR